MIRLGLCCLFYRQKINFRTTTAKRFSTLSPVDRGNHLSGICLHNARSLMKALGYCREHGIACYRISSDLLPLATHPVYGYTLKDIPHGREIRRLLSDCGDYARHAGIRTTMHPDQFVVLNSPRKEVVTASLDDLRYHLTLAELAGADVITIHGGGGYGDRESSLLRLGRAIEKLPVRIREKLALENDDRTFRPADLLPLCRALGIPFVYDVHHHRCLADGMPVEEATEHALGTWNREPLFHLSSPLDGWGGRNPSRHSMFIDPLDFPSCWEKLDATVEIEAKAKEEAVQRMRDFLQGKGVDCLEPLPHDDE